ncbi:MAG: PAS domain-containing protein, partial [Desulfobacterales bacterium]|nr:PAS domain-containing protein [Desulfobacterales bacterium]
MNDIQRDHTENSIRCSDWIELLDELNIGAFTVDADHRITRMNYSAHALMGLQDQAVKGKDCREIFFGVPCLVNCMIRGGDGSENDLPDIELPDEDSKQLVTRLATPMYGPLGEATGCLTILQDHSPLVDLINRVHHEERSLKIILDNLDIGIFTVNRGSHITFFNKAAERMSGYERDMVLGKTCAMLFGGNGANDLALLKESMTDGKPRTTSHGCLSAREGETVPIRADLMALRNEKGTIVGGMVTFQDLTLAHHMNEVIRDRYTFRNMVGKDPSMRAIFEKASVVAATDATVLIEGATGTGKDLLAKVIHSASP